MVRRLLPWVLLLFYGASLTTGIRWGLPSDERNALYSLRAELCVGSNPSRWYVAGPLQTLQVDEASALGPLARMRPEGLDLNPHFFHWGTLHTYLSGAVLGAAHILGLVTLTRDPLFYLKHPDQMANLYLMGRLLSVLLGLGTLAVTYRLAALRGGRLAGFIAGSVLATSPLFSLYSRFYTPDLCVTFLFALSVLLAARSVGRGGRGAWLAAGVAGLAASVKYNGALAFVAVVPALLPFTARRAARAGAAFVGAFLLGTPYAVVTPREFIDGVMWQWHHAGSTHGLVFLNTAPGWVFHVTSSLAYGLGWPLLAVVLAGVVLALARRRARLQMMVVATALAYYGVIGSSPLKFARYVLPLLPLMAVLGGWGWASVWRRLAAPVRGVPVVLLGAGISWGAMLCAWHTLTLMKPDTRLQAGRFLHAHGADGDTVAVFGRPYFHAPPVDADRFRVEIAAMDGRSLASLRPHWIVVSDYEYGPYVKLSPHYPEEARLFRDLLAGRFTISGCRYHPVLFSREPALWGLQLTGRDVPHDLRYTHPTVAVFRRCGGANEPGVKNQ